MHLYLCTVRRKMKSYDRDGKEVKRVTSADDGTVEDNENSGSGSTENQGGGSTGGNTGGTTGGNTGGGDNTGGGTVLDTGSGD